MKIRKPVDSRKNKEHRNTQHKIEVDKLVKITRNIGRHIPREENKLEIERGRQVAGKRQEDR